MPKRFEEFDEPLGDLWARLDTLTKSERNKLYQIISTILCRTSFPLYRRLPDMEPLDCIHMFFEDKVLTNPGGGRRMHGGGLVCIYNNYLVDVYRARRRTVEHTAESMVGPEVAPCDLSEILPDLAADESAFLSLDEKQVACAARAFLEQLDEVGRVYLTENFCAPEGTRRPLCDLAKAYQIKGYHYRAGKLGITEPRGGFGDPSEFAATQIGQWLQGLGLTVDREHRGEIAAALQILCREALSGYGNP